MKEFRFALYAIKKNIQGGAELRTSFISNVIGMTINNLIFIFLWISFVKAVGEVDGWKAVDIIALQGFVALCYGFVFSAFGGIRKMPEYVQSGTFDQFLLSPKNLISRVVTSSVHLSALGDLVFGVVSLILYAFLIKATLIQILLILLLSTITSIIFFSVTLIITSVTFYFSDPSAITASLFEFFFSPALFHGGAFQGGLRYVFIFLIPSLLLGILPTEIVRDTSLHDLLLILGLTAVWFVFSLEIFKRAVRRYESSNFMTFGN